jgi:peroxiredoxin
MKHSSLIFILYFLTILLSCRNSRNKSRNFISHDERIELNKKLVGSKFHSFSISTDNGVLSNENLTGKVIFMNFWFAGCKPCITELDQLNRLYAKYKAKPNFEFYSFSLNTPEIISKVKLRHPIDYPVFSISQKDCSEINYDNGFPCSIILTPSGVIKYLNMGMSMDSLEINSYFRNKVYPLLDSLN